MLSAPSSSSPKACWWAWSCALASTCPRTWVTWSSAVLSTTVQPPCWSTSVGGFTSTLWRAKSAVAKVTKCRTMRCWERQGDGQVSGVMEGAAVSFLVCAPPVWKWHLTNRRKCVFYCAEFRLWQISISSLSIQILAWKWAFLVTSFMPKWMQLVDNCLLSLGDFWPWSVFQHFAASHHLPRRLQSEKGKRALLFIKSSESEDTVIFSLINCI